MSMDMFMVNSDHMFWDLTAQAAKFLVQVLILWYLIKINAKLGDKDKD